MSQTTDLVKQGYNQMAREYARQRQELKSDKYLRHLIDLLPRQAAVLDLGCGNGEPVDDLLVKKGFLVTGVDISPTQIDWARRNCPRGQFLVQDVGELRPGEFEVDAVVSFYALFHLPREKHGQILQTINSFLPHGGYLLITMGDQDWEGYHQLLGVKMWSSQFGPRHNRELVTAAGFQILEDEIDQSGREKHQIILARKIKPFA